MLVTQSRRDEIVEDGYFKGYFVPTGLFVGFVHLLSHYHAQMSAGHLPSTDIKSLRDLQAEFNLKITSNLS